MPNWKIDPNTDKQWKPIIIGLHDLIYNGKDVISSLPDFEYTKDLGVIDYTVTGKARKVEVTYNRIKYVLYIHFYNRDNGNCLAVTNEANGRNLLQLVLDNYLEKTPFGARLWHDGKITGIGNLTSEKLITYIKRKVPDLIKNETGYGDYVEFGYVNEKDKLSFSNSRVLKLLSNILLFSILRHEIKKEFKSDSKQTNEDISNNLNVFFGKISKTTNPRQYIDGFYETQYPEMFNGIDVGDYSYIIADSKIQLWKAKNWSNERKKLEFEIIIDDLGINTKDLTALKYFQLNVQFVVLTIRQSPNAFYKLKIVQPLSEAQLIDISTYSNENNFRNIIVNEDISSVAENDNNINLFYENDKLEIFISDFFSPDFFDSFTDNTDKIGSGQKNKDKTLSLIKSVKVFPKLFSRNEISVLNLYDAFGVKYTEKDKRFTPEEIKEMFVAFLENEVPDSCNIYLSSIDNRIHGWAIKHSFVNESIYEKYSPSEVDDMFGQLQELEDVKINNNAFYTPMNWYRKFCRALEAGNLNNNSQENTSNLNDMETNNLHPLNQILFGPPGTGKTYNTISEAIKIVDNKFYEENSNDRDSLQKRFNDLLIKEWKNTNGQIAFCTFHQSFSYEDFVEGIKPKATDEKQVYYEIEDGIFKSICRHADATNNAQALAKNNLVSFTQEQFNDAVFYKVSLGDTSKAEGKEIYDYCISNNVISIGFGKGIDFTGKDEEQVNELVKDNNLEPYSAQAINYFKNYLQVGNYVIISNGNLYIRALGKVTGEYKFEEETEIRHNHFRSVEWIFKDVEIPVNEFYEKNLSQQTIYKLKKEFIIPTFFVKAEKQAELKTEPKNFVIIIDEINRGNVSSIFGELITLVEPTKRAGRPEALEVILPYSKLRFTVPSNVFIIGTMNTADRSIESLDTALRRRFSFKEMTPKSDLIKSEGKSNGVVGDIDLIKLLDTINDRIEKLIDKDHKIGHSYFITVDSIEHLQLAFKDKIIPLLEEYFFGDFGKIGLVLGNSFVKKEVTDFEFAKFEDYDSQTEQDLKQRAVYTIKPVEDWDYKSVYEARQ